MYNKYRSAGVWNIVCAALSMAILALWWYVLSAFWTEIEGILESSSSNGIAVVLVFGLVAAFLVLWGGFNGIPALITGITGFVMCFKKEKRTGSVALIVLNIFLKLFTVYLNVSMGVFFAESLDLTMILIGAPSLVLAVVMAVSVVMDIIALFKKEMLHEK